MKTDKILNVLLWSVSGISLVLVILATIFSFRTTALFTRVILILVAVLFLVLAGLIAYLAYMDTFKVTPSQYGSTKKPLNYFLNADGKRNGIALDDLTFEIIDKQMNHFIIDAFGSPIALWKNSVFSGEQEVFGKDGAFKVLLAYKMLSDLQVQRSKKVWKMFFELPDVDFSDLQECLVKNGDDELAKNLNMYRLTGESSVGEAAAFLDENASYIQRRMLNYVTRKIHSFDM
ncbi:MAG: hypothetical protein IKA84_03950 [Clostridia bacterium]|nr:hypothetical protein [Clostridia bacterium]